MSDSDLFGQAVMLVRNISAYAALPGTGPKGKFCKHCQHFVRRHRAKVYFKCGLGRISNVKATDIKASAPRSDRTPAGARGAGQGEDRLQPRRIHARATRDDAGVGRLD